MNVVDGLERLEYWKTSKSEGRSSSLFEDVVQGITPAIAGRVLGHELILAPNDAGRDALACDILACE